MTSVTRSRLPAGLLVSVRSVAEATEAVAGGAAIIDVKEPLRGPLGRADADVTTAIAAAVAGHAAWTVACGELADGEFAIAAHVTTLFDGLLTAGLTVPAAIKAGPAGLSVDQWRRGYERLAGRVAGRVELVAVAYADWLAAAAAEPARLIAAAADAGAATILIDTFNKSAGGLFDAAGAEAVGKWVAAARAGGLDVALAGRLSCRDLPMISAVGARIAGVRSAACDGGRLGRVGRRNVAELVGTLAGAGSADSPSPPLMRPEEFSP